MADNFALDPGRTAPKLMSMGLGAIGNPNFLIKRKFRWLFEVTDICGDSNNSIPANYVKVAARPQLDIEETELNFLHSKTWIPGKATWSEMSVTYYDVASDSIQPLWQWLVNVYSFMPVAGKGYTTYFMGSRTQDYSGNAYLTEYDGCGTPLSQWKLQYAWPKSINFGDLDYASSDECTIELTMRYSDAEYTPLCPTWNLKECCTPCSDANTHIGRVGNM